MRISLLCMVLCAVAIADFELYLKESNRIPLYAQETGYWCGAGSGQMVLEGFPEDVNHVYPQRKVWDEIQKVKVETDWYTDPDGLKNVLTLLGKGSHWQATCARTTAAMMSLVVGGMSMRKFPIPVLVYGHDHWVVVIGATTDEHPMMGTILQLKRIEAHDPWHAQHVLVDGGTWFKKYWNEKGTSGKWANCYVAVHEEEADVSRDELSFVTEEHPTQGIAISSEQALESARKSLAQIVQERSDFKELATSTFLEPRLVSHARGDYYLVPLGDAREGWSRGAIMVNAFSGQWEGLSHFQAPFRYARPRVSGRWVFRPSVQSRSPFHPAYQTSRGFLDAEGNFSVRLEAWGRGN